MNPEHSDYCNCECPEGLSYKKLEETLNRVRMLHVQNFGYCLECSIFVDDGIIWPCETMKALSGDDL